MHSAWVLIPRFFLLEYYKRKNGTSWGIAWHTFCLLQGRGYLALPVIEWLDGIQCRPLESGVILHLLNSWQATAGTKHPYQGSKDTLYRKTCQKIAILHLGTRLTQKEKNICRQCLDSQPHTHWIVKKTMKNTWRTLSFHLNYSPTVSLSINNAAQCYRNIKLTWNNDVKRYYWCGNRGHAHYVCCLS